MRGPLPVALALALLAAGCVLGPREPARPYYEELLAASPFTDLIIEIDHAPERAPSLLAQEHLVGELRNVTSKTRVSVLVEETLRDEPAKRWTPEALVALEAGTRSTAHDAPIAVLHVLYPAGEYERDGVAGVTVSGPLLGPVTVFLDTIERVRAPLGNVPLPRQARDEIERATLLHEAGHAMGLVNNGLPMVRDHEDDENPGHSTNSESVMFWRVETLDGIREAFLHDGAVPIWFDANDRDDLRSAGGR